MLHELHLLRPLWLLALLPLIWTLWKLARQHNTNNAWRDLVDAHLMPHLLIGEPIKENRLPVFLIGCGGILGILALAGPVWERLPQPIYQIQAQRVIALDLSPTMNATDVSPSRLAQARFKILDILQRTKEGQTAMLAYGVEPFLVSPMTTDAATIAAQIPNLEPDLLPVQGQRHPDLALALAEKLLQQVKSSSGEILLITDAIDYVEATQQIAHRLRTQGYTISVLGIGTAQGAPAPLSDGGFLKDANGTILIPRLQTDALATLAANGGGRYVTATIDDKDIDSLLAPMSMPAQNLSTPTKPEISGTDQWREEGPWLLLALIPLAALAFRRGWVSPLLLCLAFVSSPPAHAFEWSDLWLRPDQQAALQLKNGDPKQAAQRFQRSDWRSAAQYQAGDYAQALETLKQVQDENSEYNRGNILAKMGKLPDALSAYERFLANHPNDQDARANRDLVKQLLEQQKQQQQQQEQQSDQSQSKQQSEAKNQDSQSQNQQQSQQEKQQQAKNQSSAAQKPNADKQQQAAQPQVNDKAKQTQNSSPQEPKADLAQQHAQEKKKQSDTAKKSPSAINPQPNKNLSKSDQTKSKLKNVLAKEAEKNAQENLSEREAQQALNYMLNRVPDDPGGLLRQRFLLQHLERNRQQQ